MSEAAPAADPSLENPPKKSGLRPILLGLVGAVTLGGAGFFAVYSGMILDPLSSFTRNSSAASNFDYLPIEGVIVSLAPQSGASHLRFSAKIEVAQGSLSAMERLHPRFLDMINTYLRAVEPQDLIEPAAMVRLRAQILRRLQLIAGDGHIRDLLITEFVLN